MKPSLLDHVMIADARVDFRTMLRETMKELGAKKITACPSVKDLWSAIEQSEVPPTWIITSLDLHERVNGLHMAGLLLTEPGFLHTRLTIVLEERGEDSYLPSLFELGILSYLKKPMTKQVVHNQLQQIIREYEEDPARHALTSAKQLRELLTDSEDFPSLLRLETSLIRQFPRDGDLYLKLAEAQYLAEDTKGATSTLKQAELFGSSLSTGIKQLREVLNLDDQQTSGFAASLGFERVLIIDSDSDLHEQLTPVLEHMGFAEILSATDGEQGLALIDEKKPHLILTEWRIPKLSGPQLIQRVKLLEENPPIVVLSSLVQRQERNLLREIGVSGVVEKPVTQSIFVAELSQIMRQEHMPSNIEVVERKLRQAAESGDKVGVAKYHAMVVALEGEHNHVKLTADAFLKYVNDDFEGAKSFAVQGIRQRPDDVVLINLLAKIFLLLGDQGAAIQCLNKASTLSSDNVQRLCLLAETKQALGDQSGADDALDQASAVDSENMMVTESKVKVAIERNDVDNARGMLEGLASFSNVVSYMNNRAVALTRENKLDEAINIYHSALKALPSKFENEAHTVFYNLALAYARKNDSANAQKCLVRAAKSNDRRIQNKAASLLRRVEMAIQSGRPVALRTDTTKHAHSAATKIPMALHAHPGEICLHQIFDSKLSENTSVNQLLRDPPHYRPVKQTSINREAKGA